MFSDAQNLFSFSLSLQEVAVRFLVALVCGVIISLFYRWTYRGTSYSAAFVTSLILLSMITSSVIMVIGNNLARAFGLVGAMSIIRFRSAVKDTNDIIFIFFSLAMGMAAGVGLPQVAITGTLLIGIIVWILTITNYAVPIKREYLLQFNYIPNGDGSPAYLPILQQFCQRHKMVNVKSIGDAEDLFELSFYIKLKNKEQSEALMRALSQTHGVHYANLFFDEAQV